jgi:serine/threonine-protein kinase SRPK3
VLALMLVRVFQALDLLHKCHVAHTDIKEGNVLLEADNSVLESFEQEELKESSPRKELDRRTIYLSRELGIPEDIGAPVLCDLGSAIRLDDGVERREDIQPNIYRAPEILLDIPWTYSVDIWNVGCMVSACEPSWNFLADLIFPLEDLGRFRGRVSVYWPRPRTCDIPRSRSSR